MKRSELKRKSPLARTSSLKQGTARPKVSRQHRPLEPGEEAWKRKRTGSCVVCGTYTRLIGHHILTEQMIRRHASPEQIEAGVVWDLRNSLALGAPYVMGGSLACACHGDHHSGHHRIPLRLVPVRARVFAAEILGAEFADDYFSRYYQTEEAA